MPPDRDDVYAVLGVSPTASAEEIRAAYRRRAFETHPDRAEGSAAEFLAVASAYQLLCDPARRAELDAGRSGAPAVDATPAPEPPSDAPPATDRVAGPPTADGAAASLAAEAPLDAPPSQASAVGPAPDAAEARSPRESDAASEPVEGLGGPSAGAGTSAAAHAVPCPAAATAGISEAARGGHAPAGEATAATADGPAPAPRRPRRRPRAGFAGLAGAGVVCAALLGLGFRHRTPAPGVDIAEHRPAAEGVPDSVAHAPAAPRDPAPSASVRTVVASPTPHPPRRAAPAAQATRPRPVVPVAQESASLDAERADMEERWRAFRRRADALAEERGRLEAAAAAVSPGTSEAELASLRRREAAFGRELAAARVEERSLRERTAALNRRLEAYNARVLASRQARR